jgi:hypothetical protein
MRANRLAHGSTGKEAILHRVRNLMAKTHPGIVGCAMSLPEAGGRVVKRAEARPTRDRSDQQLDVLQQKEIDNLEIL